MARCATPTLHIFGSIFSTKRKHSFTVNVLHTYSLSLFCWQRGSHKCGDFHMHVGCESYTCQCFSSGGGPAELS